MRNELCGRLLYLIVNTLFAKVCKKTSNLTHLLLGTSASAHCAYNVARLLVAAIMVQSRLHICSTTYWGNPLRMRDLRLRLAGVQADLDLYRSQGQPRRSPGYGCTYKSSGFRLDLECFALGQEYISQVSSLYGRLRGYQFLI
jgi:hypothetical protein